MDLNRIWQSGVEKKLWYGAVVYVGNAEHVFFRCAGGLAWPDDNLPMLEDSVFDIASVTKAVGTATLAAMLYGRGQLDFDAPFTRYLPEYRGYLFLPVTVRELALHISGFHNDKPYLAVKEGRLMRSAVMEISPSKPPGGAFEYACVNYLLLGYIIEAITGESLAEAANQMIFKPLGMQNTVWGKMVNPDQRLCVKMLNAEKRGCISDAAAQLSNRPAGNAGIFSTAGDLARFCRMMLSGGRGLLTPEAYNALTTDCMPPVIRHPHSAGWDMSEEFRPSGLSAATVYHSGWTGQTVWIDPEKQLYVIVLTNRIGDWMEAKKHRLQLAEAVLSESR